jgi:hypothetical protein
LHAAGDWWGFEKLFFVLGNFPSLISKIFAQLHKWVKVYIYQWVRRAKIFAHGATYEHC